MRRNTRQIGTIMKEQAFVCMTKVIQASCVALRFRLVMSLSFFQSLPQSKEHCYKHSFRFFLTSSPSILNHSKQLMPEAATSWIQWLILECGSTNVNCGKHLPFYFTESAKKKKKASTWSYWTRCSLILSFWFTSTKTQQFWKMCVHSPSTVRQILKWKRKLTG